VRRRSGKHWVGLAGLGLAVSVATLAQGAPQATLPSAEERAIIEKQLLPLPTRVQVAVAVVTDGGVRFLGAARTKDGVRYIENRTALFEIGSISKVFTATLLAQQVQRGTLALDTPVRTLVPFALHESARDGVEVTLRHLATHTSGMCHQPPGLNRHALFHGHSSEPFKDYDQARFEAFLKDDMELAFTPGTKYSYSNMGMSLVGYILALKLGKSYEEILQADLLVPLGMTSTTTRRSKVAGRVIGGIEKEGVDAPSWDMGALAPCGGVLACTEDFAKLIQAQFGTDPAIALTQKSAFPIEEGYSVGLGWHIVERKNGERWLNHGGGMAGYTAIVNVNVKRRCGVVVLSNLGNAHKLAENVSQIGRDLLKAVEVGPEGKSSPAGGSPPPTP